MAFSINSKFRIEQGNGVAYARRAFFDGKGYYDWFIQGATGPFSRDNLRSMLGEYQKVLQGIPQGGVTFSYEKQGVLAKKGEEEIAIDPEVASRAQKIFQYALGKRSVLPQLSPPRVEEVISSPTSLLPSIQRPPIQPAAVMRPAPSLSSVKEYTEAGLKLSGCPTQPAPIFESRAVYPLSKIVNIAIMHHRRRYPNSELGVDSVYALRRKSADLIEMLRDGGSQREEWLKLLTRSGLAIAHQLTHQLSGANLPKRAAHHLFACIRGERDEIFFSSTVKDLLPIVGDLHPLRDDFALPYENQGQEAAMRALESYIAREIAHNLEEAL